MMTKELTYNYLEDFVNEIRAKGRYIFSLSEVKSEFQLSEQAIKKSLSRLKSKHRIARIGKGFYAIITPEYASFGMLPPHLFIDDMMKELNKKYYVGVLSAAALYGAGHQQPMEYFVITEKPALRDIEIEKLKINFLTKIEWFSEDIVEKKTDAGYIQVSSPELTALDLIYYPQFGLNRVSTILLELVEEMKASALTKTARTYPQTAALQRLGYLLDRAMQEDKLSEALFKVLQTKKYYSVALASDKDRKGETDSKWKVIVNTTIEADL
ncbi:type IV toxin-antitoxin system AbiEi family antitoxin [Reichenbachiella sp. MALMAid0571]|uniref:type IV toxin-antitoxin system AbiEi family antitoxin domain-containing protein n=1 Tax=Reichenbachiella sp. MALMAid0571 TaxID=3143939 RepID=UPI0032DF511F